jgi:hypothetical protein
MDLEGHETVEALGENHFFPPPLSPIEPIE